MSNPTIPSARPPVFLGRPELNKMLSSKTKPTNTKGFVPGSGDIYSILAQLELERSQLAGQRLQGQAQRMKSDNELQKALHGVEEKIAEITSKKPAEASDFTTLNNMLIKLEEDFGLTGLSLSKSTNDELSMTDLQENQNIKFGGDGLEGQQLDPNKEENKKFFDNLTKTLENRSAEISDREDERNITISRYQNQMSRSMQGSAARQQAGQQLFSAIFNRI